MQIRNVLAITMLLSFGNPSSPASAAQSESFNSDASATANGWMSVGNGINGQTVGWIGTNEAGGAAGEAQFDIGRGAQTMYADTTLGMVINGNGSFSMTGRLNLTGLVGGDTGFPPILGFFSSPDDYLGIIFRAEGGVNWGLRFGTTAHGIILGPGGTPPYRLTPDTPYTFSFSYDPSEGAFGTIRAQVIGAGPEIIHPLPEAHRNVLNVVAFDKAGFIKKGNAFDNESLQIRADDLTYTAIPEPSTIALGFVLIMSIGFRSARLKPSYG